MICEKYAYYLSYFIAVANRLFFLYHANAQQYACKSAVPQLFITPVDAVVDEATAEVEVCVNLDTTLGRSVVVTVETRQKTGAGNQATGI